jgi:hypothetical protein
VCFSGLRGMEKMNNPDVFNGINQPDLMGVDGI